MKIDVVHHDSPLGRFTTARSSPDFLSGLAVLWYSEGEVALPHERVLPTGICELAVVLGDPHRLVDGAGVETLGPSFTGLLSRPIVLAHPDRHRVLGIRLHPFAAYALAARPMREMADLTVDLADLFGSAAAELAERCHDAPTLEERMRRAAAWLTERLRRARGVDEAVAWAAREIERTAGAIPIAHLRERTGLSKSRMVGAFREQVGVAPKVYARIVRFRRVLSMLDAGAPSLADAALDAGYYDQAHMNADFRELGGMTPREFVKSRYPGGSTAAEWV